MRFGRLFSAGFFALLSFGCAADVRAREGKIEFLPRQRIASLTTGEDGGHVICFARSARYFAIDPENEEAEAMLDLARRETRLAMDYREELYVTVSVFPGPEKARAGDPTRLAPPPHVVRIAPTPDPRAEP
jgi:hypothetical protein